MGTSRKLSSRKHWQVKSRETKELPARAGLHMRPECFFHSAIQFAWKYGNIFIFKDLYRNDWQRASPSQLFDGGCCPELRDQPASIRASPPSFLLLLCFSVKVVVSQRREFLWAGLWTGELGGGAWSFHTGRKAQRVGQPECGGGVKANERRPGQRRFSTRLRAEE